MEPFLDSRDFRWSMNSVWVKQNFTPESKKNNAKHCACYVHDFWFPLLMVFMVSCSRTPNTRIKNCWVDLCMWRDTINTSILAIFVEHPPRGGRTVPQVMKRPGGPPDVRMGKMWKVGTLHLLDFPRNFRWFQLPQGPSLLKEDTWPLIHGNLFWGHQKVGTGRDAICPNNRIAMNAVHWFLFPSRCNHHPRLKDEPCSGSEIPEPIHLHGCHYKLGNGGTGRGHLGYPSLDNPPYHMQAKTMNALNLDFYANSTKQKAREQTTQMFAVRWMTQKCRT